MIELYNVVELFSYNQDFVPHELSALANGLYTGIFKRLLLWNRLANFHQFSHGLFCWRDVNNLFEGSTIIQDGRHAYIK